MDWNRIPYFLAVARAGSLRAAADDMGIPLPVLLLILVGILGVLLTMALFRTWRTKEGN